MASSQSAGAGMSVAELEAEIEFQEVMLRSLQGAEMENQAETETQIMDEIRVLKSLHRGELRKQGLAVPGTSLDKRGSSVGVRENGKCSVLL